MTDCQLYLTLPDLPDADLVWLPELLANRPIAALRLATTDATRAACLISALRGPVQGHDIALMLTGLADLARTQGCDGVEIMAGAGATATIRRALGDDLQLGVSCGASRDQAMQAGEDGADYVSFDGPAATVADLVGWWVGVAELPAVAMLGAVEDAPAVLAAGADFIGFTLPGTADDARRALEVLCAALAA